MADTNKRDASGGVNPEPVPSSRPGKRGSRQPAFEFKLERVREAGGSQSGGTPEGAFGYWRSNVADSDWFQETKEHLVVLLLDARLMIEGHNLVSIGTLTETLAHPREILSPVICGAADGFILMHNHPSGDPTPSRGDKALTRRISEGASLLQLRFVDHVIAGREGADCEEPFFSFKETGLL